jgi:hypothetical protein
MIQGKTQFDTRSLIILEDKAKALQSLTIGFWINGLRLLDVENYETQVLLRI